MPVSDLDQEKARHKQELGVERQIAFTSGLFQGDITIRTLLEALAEGVVIFDIRGTILLVNTLAEQMFGYPNKDLIGKPLAVLIPERLLTIHEEQMEHFFAEPMIKPKVQFLDLAGRRQDGSEFPVEISLSYIETINGILALAFVTDIAPRKQVEQHLRESEKLFRIQVECVKDYAIFMLDTQGNILNWNEGAERMKGYEEKEIIGKHFSCFYPEEERNAGKPEEELKKAAALGRFKDEGWRIRKDGSRFWAEVTFTSIYDESWNLQGFSKVTHDITERKKAEDEIQDAREYAENIVETVREPLVVLNSDLKILTANHSFYEIFKVTPEDTIGKFVYDLGNRQWDIPKLRVLIEEILPLETVFNGYEVEHDFPDIGRKTILLNARQIFRENIGSHIILLAMEDITARKRLEEEIKDAREYAENIVETVREPLVVLNSDLKILTANHSFYETFKVTPEETIGNFIYDLGNRQWDIPKLRVLFEDILPLETVFNGYEVEHDFPDIGRKIVLLNARQIFRENIGSRVILLAMEDITKRRHAEIALSENKRALEELNSSLELRIVHAVEELRQKDQMMILQDRQAIMGEMINNIAHQWRQPLNTLGLVLQQLPLYYDTPEFNREFLEENTGKCMELIQNMSQTIDDFKNFFRADKEKVAFSVNQVIARTLSLIEKSFTEQKIDIALHPEGDPMANGYPNEYSQVLLNIFMNARDALIGHNAEDALISIHAFVEGDKAVVTITDNAGGVAEEIMNKLFDAHFTTKDPDKGTGLGLFMSKTIIEKSMGGRLTVRNTGSGAEFRIEI